MFVTPTVQRQLRRSLFAYAGALLLIFFSSAFPSPSTEARPREVVRISVDGNYLDVETARTPEDRERGLKYRAKLCATCGMLFVYPQADRRGFYTKHVFMELDVGYFGEDGRLLEWRTMAADDARNTFPAGEAFQYALAVPAGWFARHQIRKYAVLRLPHDLRAL